MIHRWHYCSKAGQYTYNILPSWTDPWCFVAQAVC